MKRIITPGGQTAIYDDEILHRETFAEIKMRSCPSPTSSASVAERSALSIIASM